MAKHTLAPWIEAANQPDAIVSATEPEVTGWPDQQEYYGGYLVCESVSPRDRALIKAAPKLLAWITDRLKQARKQLIDLERWRVDSSEIRLRIAEAEALIIEAGGSLDE